MRKRKKLTASEIQVNQQFVSYTVGNSTCMPWMDYEEILALNNPQEVGTIKSFTLELNYALIVELFDTMNFTFPKGTYWATDDYKWLTDDVNETIYKEITIVKFSRKGKEITLGKVNIGDGKVFDIDLSQTQEKLANKISKALRELKDLILCVNKERKEV